MSLPAVFDVGGGVARIERTPPTPPGPHRAPLPSRMLALLIKPLERFFIEVGQYGLLLTQAVRSILNFRTYQDNLFVQMVRIGVESLPIVMLAGAFTGAVTTVQTGYQLVSPLLPRSIIGGVVVPSILLELAAIMTALVLAGRVGARIAAELGTMNVTEQVDALEAMGLSSVAYLVIPRVVAGAVMFPVLYVAAALVGIGGGMLAGELSGAVTMQEFLDGGREFFRPYDVFFGLTKAFVFGFLVTSISCAKGYFTTGGAEDVGRSTTSAAVTSCVMVLLADYVLAELLL